MLAAIKGAVRNWRQPLLLLLAAAGAAQAADEQLFPRPAGLEPDIGFWVDIYTRFESDTGVLHDSRDLNVVYGAVALPDNLGRRSRSKRIEASKKDYRTILEMLAGGKRDGLSTEEQRVLAQWPADVSNRTLRDAAKRIRFQLGQADRFKAGLTRSGEYKPFIAKTLAERQLPQELGALPHVESSFEPRAYSKVGAAGLWQFTRSTGRRYMRVDHVVDERRDPFLSTTAAAQLLENNYSVTDSWPLAITGYNHGVAGMRRAARQLDTKDIETIVRNYKGRTFGFASRNFYVAFLAAVQVDDSPEKYFGPVRFELAARHTLVAVEDYVPADELSAVFNMDVAALKRLNPALQQPVWSGSKHVPKGFTLRLPGGQVEGDPEKLLANLDPEMRFSAQLPDVTHRVSRGETLSGIADRYGVRITDLVAMNGLRSRNRIRAGQVLRLPTRGQPVPVKPAEKSPAPTVVAVAKTAPPPTISAQQTATPIGTTAPPNPATPPTADLQPKTQPSELGADLAASQPELAADLPPESQPPSLNADPATSQPELAADLSSVEQPADINAGLTTSQAELAADPSDYAVAADGSIEIQALETLGHYADWLEIRTQRLRDINGYKFERPVVIGEHMELDLSRVDSATFEARRVAYHRELQEDFFLRYQIKDTQSHVIRQGESIWILANRKYGVPVWLLRQFNPDLDLDRTRPGTRVQFPLLEPIGASPPDQRRAAS